MSSVSETWKGAGAIFLWSPSTDKPVLTQPLGWPALPTGRDSISGCLIRLGEVGVTERCKGRMKGMVQKGLIMRKKVFGNLSMECLFQGVKIFDI